MPLLMCGALKAAMRVGMLRGVAQMAWVACGGCERGAWVEVRRPTRWLSALRHQKRRRMKKLFLVSKKNEKAAKADAVVYVQQTTRVLKQ